MCVVCEDIFFLELENSSRQLLIYAIISGAAAEAAAAPHDARRLGSIDASHTHTHTSTLEHTVFI